MPSADLYVTNAISYICYTRQTGINYIHVGSEAFIYREAEKSGPKTIILAISIDYMAISECWNQFQSAEVTYRLLDESWIDRKIHGVAEKIGPKTIIFATLDTGLVERYTL